MSVTKKKLNPWFKRVLFGIVLFAVLGAGAIWYIFNEKFSDTSGVNADLTISAMDLIHEFEKNDSLANKKYGEKIIVVNGMVSEVEGADTTVNLKMADTSTGSYIIFAFQPQHREEAKGIKQGQEVSVKGSCSGGAFSQILGTEFITFKRCALNK
ncbi:MAG: nucleic acid binding OB-fold tRNA/helicase-type [Ferruginibacter sp.]|nr:nucleic acid binding OB-fold tRNA/helicase-type [Ferruginibacter sp.]